MQDDDDDNKDNDIANVNEERGPHSKYDKIRKEALKYRENLAKRGVIYLSRIPPFMKPNKVRSIFEEFGEVTRLYLAEEDGKQRLKRKEKGGNASKQFQEGWIEFAERKLAKSVAESLNNTRIDVKKGGFYHDDLWNIKYLKHFKWDYLTEKLSYERRVRDSKINLAMTHAKRSNAEVVNLMEKTKVQRIVEGKKRKREENGDREKHQAADAREEMNKVTKKVRQVKGMDAEQQRLESRINVSLLRSALK